MKKVVGITNAGPNIVVVCEDGSVWFTTHPASDWKKGKPVPESEAANQ